MENELSSLLAGQFDSEGDMDELSNELELLMSDSIESVPVKPVNVVLPEAPTGTVLAFPDAPTNVVVESVQTDVHSTSAVLA